jgi:hypothetical protein
VTTLQERLAAIREETRHLVAIEGMRPLTVVERARATHLKLEAEGLLLEMQRLRAAVEATRQVGHVGGS